jgi:hypothetical protein
MGRTDISRHPGIYFRFAIAHWSGEEFETLQSKIGTWQSLKQLHGFSLSHRRNLLKLC